MKEFVGKLIERLEKLSGEAEQNMNYCEELSLEDESYNVPASVSRKKYEAYQEVLNIAIQLAEEYDNAFCEWKWGIDFAQVQCQGDRILFGSRRLFSYCPYCGKKIKVVE